MHRLVSGPQILLRAVCHKFRDPDSVVTSQLTVVTSQLTGGPLDVAVEALLGRLPEACDASERLHGDVHSLSTSLEDERKARMREEKAKREEQARQATEIEALTQKLAATEKHLAQLLAGLKMKEEHYEEQSKLLEKSVSEARAAKLKAEQELDAEQASATSLRLEASKLKAMLEDAETTAAAASKDVQDLKQEKYAAQEVHAKQTVQLDSAVAKLDSAQVRIASWRGRWRQIKSSRST